MSIILSARSDIKLDSQFDHTIFNMVIEQVLKGLGSSSSKKQYKATYNKWLAWCKEHNLNPIFGVNINNIDLYLKDQSISFNTRQNQLSHIRKIILFLSIPKNDTPQQHFYNLLKEIDFYKIPTEGANEKTRKRSALSPDQVRKVLSVWENGTTLLDIRNQAFISLSLATGSRVSEVCKLRWQDIDFDEGIIDITSGKGNKSRRVAIVDGAGAINDLIQWSLHCDDSRNYIFCPIYKGDNIGKDKPMSASSAQKMISTTSKLSGIKFTHHTFRRTHVTEHIRNGASIGDIQAQTGHARAQTLLENYYVSAEASKRRETLRNRWGKE